MKGSFQVGLQLFCSMAAVAAFDSGIRAQHILNRNMAMATDNAMEIKFYWLLLASPTYDPEQSRVCNPQTLKDSYY